MMWQFILPIALSIASAAADTSANLKAGKVQGVSCSDSKANSFLGIPFAKPPTGNLRFAPPVAYDGSYPGGTLNASVVQSACEQFGGTGGIGYIPSATSEDWYA